MHDEQGTAARHGDLEARLDRLPVLASTRCTERPLSSQAGARELRDIRRSLGLPGKGGICHE